MILCFSRTQKMNLIDWGEVNWCESCNKWHNLGFWTWRKTEWRKLPSRPFLNVELKYTYNQRLLPNPKVQQSFGRGEQSEDNGKNTEWSDTTMLKCSLQPFVFQTDYSGDLAPVYCCGPTCTTSANARVLYKHLEISNPYILECVGTMTPHLHIDRKW